MRYQRCLDNKKRLSSQNETKDGFRGTTRIRLETPDALSAGNGGDPARPFLRAAPERTKRHSSVSALSR